MALRPGRRTRAFGVVAAMAAVLALPATVSADTGGGGVNIPPRTADAVVVDVEGAALDNRLMATISFQMVCEEITYFDWDLWQEVTTTDGRLSGDAQLAQAQGRSIATAVGAVYGVGVTCDGTTVNHLSIQVIAQNLPLRRGDALVGVTVFVGSAQVGEGDEHGASGPTAVKLR